MRTSVPVTGLIVLCSLNAVAQAQRPGRGQPPAQPAAAEQPAAARDTSRHETGAAPREESSVTEHTIRINGQTIAYKATAATMILTNDSGAPIGSLYYTAYTKNGISDLSQRPISFIYNGGPGSASMWLHMGAYGPKRIVTTEAGYTPPAPYQIVDNENTLLDATDMVFIDPIGTGFSKPVGKGTGKDFWGLDEDARSITQFIYQYVSRSGRWNSPKFLIGESYGTTRSAVLVNRLQQQENMDFNGVVLMSSVLDFETLEFAPGHDISYVLYLPSYAATAAYHHAIPTPANLPAFLDEVRTWAMGPYAAALAKGSSLPAADRAAALRQLSAYTGLSQDYLDRANLRVSLGQFSEELNRSKGEVSGRLDSRFLGNEFDLLSEGMEYDPQSEAIGSAFMTAINSYLRDELKFPAGDQRYVGGGAVQPWDWNRLPQGRRGGGGGGGFFRGATYVGSDLANALVSNPNLKVEVENGYYDMATPFFATEYTMDHLGVNPTLRSNITLKYYEAGHMMYLHVPDLAKLKANVVAFIQANAHVGQ
jgi:carboxypeptidase C (cathepsin A)